VKGFLKLAVCSLKHCTAVILAAPLLRAQWRRALV